MNIIVMSKNASMTHVTGILRLAEENGFTPKVSSGDERTIIEIMGDDRGTMAEKMQMMQGVEKVISTSKPYKLVSREWKPTDTVIDVRGRPVGAKALTLIAGPCSVESESQLMEIAFAIKEAGATVLRGGAFKPRTSPYSFQGLGEKGLELLALAREKTGLSIVTEVVNPNQVELVARYADVLQVGARNSQNFALLQEVGKSRKPVLLKRGMMSNVEEYLMCAEYVLASGNDRVILCERGIRTFETYTRNTMDIASIPLLKQLSHLPVIADPSHATGKRSLVVPVAKAALAAGADGLMIEVHHAPENALSDGLQAILPDEYFKLVQDIRQMAPLFGRTV
jgi:3-deoxy-7-phosphoheptulonate synthase